ncbi:MAG: hypothetical protein KBG07_00660 [Elusimicrobia bacterium]|nr:hypothetical protein [Elusimicrobiota bacterium]MBP9127262.1 hypothetical protein [Elusimicrobiota bacterium]
MNITPVFSSLPESPGSAGLEPGRCAGVWRSKTWESRLIPLGRGFSERDREQMRAFHLQWPISHFALFEPLSESRISVLCLARQAKELTEKGQSLRTEMDRLRRTVTIEWTKETKTHIARAETAQSELTTLIEAANKSAMEMRFFTRALSTVSTLLALAKKAI